MKEYCEVELGEEDVREVIYLGKYDETKKRPVLTAIKTEEKKERNISEFVLIKEIS